MRLSGWCGIEAHMSDPSVCGFFAKNAWMVKRRLVHIYIQHILFALGRIQTIALGQEMKSNTSFKVVGMESIR